MSRSGGNIDTGSTSERKEDRVSIVDLKNGKVVFKQKPISFEKQSDTLQEIVKFREMLEDRINQQLPPLTTFPDEHRPLIAKLAHESDKSLAQLTKHIHQELLPTLDEDDDNKKTFSLTHAALPLTLVENAIKAVLIRNNYGLDAPPSIKIPAAVCVWRWEVRNEHFDWLPKNSREKAESRQTDRIQAREDLKLLFEALSQEERDAIIDPKGTSKLPVKELNMPIGEGTSQISDLKSNDVKAPSSNSKKQGKKKADEVENDTQTDVKTSRPKKIQDPEKTAKEQERLEKKLARAEREKKEKEAQNKSQSIMAKFFAKPKASSPADVAVAVAGPSKLQSDFERTFKPFVLQKDKVLAPTNWFLAARKRRKTSSRSNQIDVITIDSDDEVEDVQMQDAYTNDELTNMTSRDLLNDILLNLPPPAYPSCSRRTRQSQSKPSLQYKMYHPLAVRDIMSQLSEAEIGQNDDLVRVLLDKLRDRTLLPAKALSFHTDARPGYFGTWTRNSRIIGPRTPLAKDTLVFDYGYDSGEEWEEEPVGDADDVVDDGEEEDGEEEPDSDLESWLVDDDDEPVISIHDESSPPPLLDLTAAAPTLKRKADNTEKKSVKKRKAVVPLTPFAKGPIWESTIGQCNYDPFNPYRIQLFNDTLFPINPFSYVSTCIEDHKASLRTSNGAHTDDVVFAVPALPPRLAPSNAVDSSSSSSTVPPVPKKAPVTAKSPFPECHVGFLLKKITQLQAPSISALVESIYLDLREHKVKKTAIEAKVREVGEKCKEKKVWVVKPALLQAQVTVA